MTTKQEIVSELGEPSLLLPVQVNAGLRANDQVKYYLTLLQAACLRADLPGASIPNLRAEREAAAIDDTTLDEVPANSRLGPPGCYDLDRAAELYRLIFAGVEAMLLPLETSDSGGDRVRALRARLDRIVEAVPPFDGGLVPASSIGMLTRAQPREGDSLHLLVMDLHRELNRLQLSLAQETIDAASVYGLSNEDRPLVQAFMRGLNATAPLKFNHPGLGTTATRSGSRLVIQNDIGETDAHVLVIQVDDTAVTLTYTDVHQRRVSFFQQLLRSFPVQWTGVASRQSKALASGQPYYLSVGVMSRRKTIPESNTSSSSARASSS